jgi:hypothetical protein
MVGTGTIRRHGPVRIAQLFLSAVSSRIQAADGAEQLIAYTDTTEISGAQKDAAGLATMKNARVTVHFTEDAQAKTKFCACRLGAPRRVALVARPATQVASALLP